MSAKKKHQIARKSDTLDMSEAWWQVWFVNIALSRAKYSVETTDINLTVVPPPARTDNDQLSSAILAAGEDLDDIGTYARTQVTFGSVYMKLEDLPHHGLVWDENLSFGNVEDITAPTDTTLLVPTQDAIDAFHRQQEWFDSLKYQQENHSTACTELGIPNPSVPKITGMRRNVSLRFWQPVAIKAMCDMATNPLLNGCVLADAVGLGKTWTTAGYLLAVCILS